MNNIEWKDGVVCYTDAGQWVLSEVKKTLKRAKGERRVGFEQVLNQRDFKLNEIREGDFISASELNTEQKYNEVVEVFGLFGFDANENTLHYKQLNTGSTHYFASSNYGIDSVSKIKAFKRHCKGRQLTYNQIIAIGKLKRMMMQREKSAPETATDFTKASPNKYEREITDRQGNSATVDVYDVLKAFEVTCPATQHAVKKLLCSGLRGHKDLQTDLIEAKESIVRAIELN